MTCWKIKRKKYQKSQILTKHGVENLVAVAKTYTLDKQQQKNPESCPSIKFSKSGKVS